MQHSHGPLINPLSITIPWSTVDKEPALDRTNLGFNFPSWYVARESFTEAYRKGNINMWKMSTNFWFGKGFFAFFNWNISDLQHFRYTAKRFCYTYFSSDSFPIMVITGYWLYFPVLYSRSLLFILYIVSSVCIC